MFLTPHFTFQLSQKLSHLTFLTESDYDESIPSALLLVPDLKCYELQRARQQFLREGGEEFQNIDQGVIFTFIMTKI